MMPAQLKVVQEKRQRTLSVRLPRTIKNKEEVEQLFTGDFEVKLPRQSSRQCHVLFSSVEEKLRNLKAVKDLRIHGKRILAKCLPTRIEKETKAPKKKTVMPKIKEDVKITQTLFVGNIKCGTRMQEVLESLEGCLTVRMLKPYKPQLKAALAKMESIQIAAEYLTGERECPVVNGNKLTLKPDTRKKHKRSKSSKTIKIIPPLPEEGTEGSDSLDRSDDDLKSQEQPKDTSSTGSKWRISKVHITDD